ncbi:hypothetical protein G3N95_01710 [Paraburkholderia sp. Tr-20389]|uniref:hypothetical protein n=1 Tax=Paraburkholderia sp. Tr-20389 TaxID=2703903 RepID=UPI00197EEFCD|nr:hypothetical protein [Paraburkholderia sp. Tr-20389]MBN3751638.1 hypothetical protein [Paraburkholderia sp. Tr-20389]
MKKTILAVLTGLLSISAFAQMSAPMAAPADNAAPMMHHRHHQHMHKHHHRHTVTAQRAEVVKP